MALQQVNHCVDATTNELVLWWNPVDYAEEYELEILYVDDYAEDGSAIPASAIAYDFRESAVRLQVNQTHYRLPLVYDRGYHISCATGRFYSESKRGSREFLKLVRYNYNPERWMYFRISIILLMPMGKTG